MLINKKMKEKIARVSNFIEHRTKFEEALKNPIKTLPDDSESGSDQFGHLTERKNWGPLEYSGMEKSSIDLCQITILEWRFKEKYNRNLDAVLPRYILSDLMIDLPPT